MADEKRDINETFVFHSGKEIRPGAVKQVVDSVIQSNHTYALTGDDLRLVVDEAVTNAMEHGNQWDYKRKVVVKIASLHESLFIHVYDEGKGFDVHAYENGSASRGGMSKRGRGIMIISKLCDVNWNSQGNKVYISIKNKN